jgi:hypothetical protein
MVVCIRISELSFINTIVKISLRSTGFWPLLVQWHIELSYIEFSIMLIDNMGR